MRAARNATPGTATAVATSPRRIVDPPVGGLGQRRETGCWRDLSRSAGRRATVGEHDGRRIRIDVGQVISCRNCQRETRATLALDLVAGIREILFRDRSD